MKRFELCLCIAMALLITACSGGQTEKLQKTIDSLQTINLKNETELEGMSYFMATLAEGLDTIAKQEGQLFYSNKGPEGTLVDREQLKKNLQLFAQTLQDQRAKIKMLTDSINHMGENAANMRLIIENLEEIRNLSIKVIHERLITPRNEGPHEAVRRSKIKCTRDF